MKSVFKKLFHWISGTLFLPFWLISLIVVIPLARLTTKGEKEKPRLLFGGRNPIISHAYWAKAMKQDGYKAVTLTEGYYKNIHKREDWDLLIKEHYRWLPKPIRHLLVFNEMLLKFDIFIMNFDGHVLGQTPLWSLQAYLFKWAGKKTILMPFGGDSYIYNRIKSTSLTHALLMVYDTYSRQQRLIAKRVDYWCEHADVVIPGIMGADGFGRWDVLTPSPFSIDTSLWKASTKNSFADGINDTVSIIHSPNHRGFKGTEFIIEAVNTLKSEGLKVELLLTEKIQNSDLKKLYESEADIHVEQIIFTGYAMNAVEGMASGLPVICNLEDPAYTLPMRRWSYFSECPIVSSSPETLLDNLRKLVTRPELRHQLGKANREYAEKYHGFEASRFLFNEVIDYMYGRREAPLIHLYHPLLCDKTRDIPKVQHPLKDNRILD